MRTERGADFAVAATAAVQDILWATQNHQLETVKDLISRGYDVDRRNKVTRGHPGLVCVGPVNLS